MSDPLASTSAPAAELSLTDQVLLHRLGWFVRIRWVVGVFCLALLLLGHHALGVRFLLGDAPLSIWRPVHVVAGLFAYNAVFAWLVGRVRAGGQVTRARILRLGLGQIICDLLGVCALVHVTGGVENYFIILTVLPLVIASELLPRGLSYSAAAGAVVLIHALAWSEQQGLIPHVRVTWPGAARSALWADPLYVLEVTGALTVLLLGTVLLASTIAGQLRQREEDLEAAYRQIRLTDEAKGFFMRKAGHELRAPLVAVGTILKAIVQTVQFLPDEQRRLLDRAWQRTNLAMTVLDDLRRYSSLHSVQTLRTCRVVDLGQAASAQADLLRPQAESAGLRLGCLVDPAPVDGDPELLRELVSNLLNNAMQYTPSGGRIDVAVHRHGPTVRLEVRDTGIGISPQARQRLFEEFFRAEEAKKVFAEGTGLGLAICRRIAQMHGGRIEAAGRPEGGSVFTVELPASQSGLAEASGPRPGALSATA